MRLPLAFALAFALAAPPALAESEFVGYTPVVASSVTAPEPVGPDPVIAASLTIGAPLALGLSAIVVPALSEGGGMFLPFFVPLGLTAGHIYAGDPMRGLATMGLGMAGLGIVYAAGVFAAFYERGMMAWLSIPIFAVGTAAVFGYAARDAYETAERRRAELAPAP